MADFDWAALKTAILNDLQNGSALTKSYNVEGRSRTFQDLSEVLKLLELCDGQVFAAARGQVNYAGFRRPAGGFRRPI